MEQLKKYILIVVASLWMVHPCFAASTNNDTATKKQRSVTVKKKSTATTKKKSSSVKKTTKKAPGVTKKTKKTKKSSRNQPNRVSSIAANQHAVLMHSNHIEASSPGFVASIEHRLVEFVHKTVATLRYSVYKLGGQRFDTSRGVYILDCSSYVDRILEAIYPQAYSNLVDWTGSDKPTSYDFYNFFTSLSEKSQRYWTTVDDVEQLRPGDILVFRYKNSSGDETGGHVMIVMDKPIFNEDDAFHIRVADSASSRHSEDTRVSNVSGIGIGTMLLKVNPKTYQPSAYAWRVGSRFKNNAYFAMARPIEKNQS